MEQQASLPVGINPDLSSIKRVLIVVAHPDDIDFGSAGTVAVLTDQNIYVSYLLVTSGDAGGDDDGLTKNERMLNREQEQSAAGEVVGVETIHYLRQPDGEIECNLALREKITRVIRKEKPDLVITQSPQRRYDRIFASHPDHLAVGEATLSAVYPDSQNPNSFIHLLDEGYSAHKVKAVWIVADENPDTFIDITDVFDRKMEALEKHESQISDKDQARKMLMEWGQAMAQLGGISDDRCCEAYRFVQIDFS
ncbi:MAG: PIG-L deacetylase family protein [Acidimicrobiia bacterium]